MNKSIKWTIEDVKIMCEDKPKEGCKKLNLSKASMYTNRWIIKCAGGLDNVIKMMKEGMSFSEIAKQVRKGKILTSVKKSNNNDITEKTGRTREMTTTDLNAKYKNILSFLVKSGLIEQVKNTICKHMANILEVNKYIADICEKIKNNNLLDKMEFFANAELELQIIAEEVMEEHPYIQKSVVPVVKEVVKEKKVFNEDILSGVYTTTRIMKEYPKFFLTEKQVTNFIKMNISKLVGHVLLIPNTDEYVLDETGTIILLDIAEQVEKETDLPDSVLLSSPLVQQEIGTTLLETIEPAKIENNNCGNLDAGNNSIVYEKKEVENTTNISDNLMDSSAICSLSVRKIKHMYLNDREFFNGLSALREDSQKNTIKKSVTKFEFNNYCNGEESDKRIYLIEKEGEDVFWVVKKTDFNSIISNYYKENNLGVADIPKVHLAFKARKLITNYNENKNAIIVNWNKLKKTIDGKQGLLNSIPFLKL